MTCMHAMKPWAVKLGRKVLQIQIPNLLLLFYSLQHAHLHPIPGENSHQIQDQYELAKYWYVAKNHHPQASLYLFPLQSNWHRDAEQRTLYIWHISHTNMFSISCACWSWWWHLRRRSIPVYSFRSFLHIYTIIHMPDLNVQDHSFFFPMPVIAFCSVAEIEVRRSPDVQHAEQA